MFGYLRTEPGQLRVCELEGYKAVYCGLCRQLKKRFGPVASWALSYDFTFLALLQLALGEEEITFRQGRCAFNPLKKIAYPWPEQGLEYACDVAQLALFYKLRDDVADNGLWRGLGARLGLWMMGKRYQTAARRYPALDQVMAAGMVEQAALEAAGTASLDQASQPTAQMVAAILEPLAKTPQERRVLERLGWMLGRYIYLADALDDLEQDRKAGRYNPLLCGGGQPHRQREAGRASLYLTIAEAGVAYSLLEVRRLGPILENIVGVGLRAQADRLCGSAPHPLGQKGGAEE